MIPNQTDRVVTNSLQGTTVRMGFAAGAEKHLIGLLTDMYSDTELAVIREYSTNAHDSHIMAGNNRPIEVTTPSPLSPFLKIKDYGLGLSVDDIHNIYSQYGASTKRESNDANGMLGIGCKAALTYSSQFTVVGVKGGVRTTVAVSRDADGSNSMTIVDTANTTDANGVEIVVPAKGGNTIESKAAKFFANWAHGTVLLNGEEPKHHEGMRITDQIMLVQTDRYSDNDSKIVMAGVTYPAGDKLSAGSLGVPYGYAVVATVPTGSVDFAPSREALTFSRVTNEVIEQIARDFKANLVPAVQRELEKLGTRQEAVSFVNKWSKVLGRSKPASFRFKGADMPTSIVRPTARQADGSSYRMLLTDATNYKLSAASNVPMVDLTYLDNAVWVTGYTLGNFTVTHKKKLLMWLEAAQKADANFRTGKFILVDFPLDTTWIDKSRVIKWDDVNALKLPRVERLVSGRLPGSYDIVVRTLSDRTRYRHGVAGTEIDQSKPVYYMNGNRMESTRFTSILDQVVPEYTLVLLPMNRIGKFTRENPQIIHVREAIKGAYDKWKASLSKSEVLALHISDEVGMSDFCALAPHSAQIKDPEVKAAIQLSKIDLAPIERGRRAFRHEVRSVSEGIEWENPMERYPLFPSTGYGFTRLAEHAVSYMNFVYETQVSA